jgi:hypothetical protein
VKELKPHRPARELYDRRNKKGEEYPADVILGCNPNAYFYARDLMRTVEVGMPNRSYRTPLLIERADSYRCHSQVEYRYYC